MELRTMTTLLALLSSMLLTLTTVSVQARAKCRGKWRIHACLGGNGKRSDPRLSGSSPLTLASRLKVARRLALQAAVRSGYESQQPLSFLSRLQPEPEPSFSDKLLASELAAILQEDNIPREKMEDPVFDSTENAEEEEDDADFGDDVTIDDEADDIAPVDMETVRDIRDIFNALTLQRALRTEGLREGRTDTRDEVL